jgi:hypothetical protein
MFRRSISRYFPSRREIKLVHEITDSPLNKPSIYNENSSLVRVKTEIKTWYKVTYVKITPRLEDDEKLEMIREVIEDCESDLTMEQIEDVVNHYANE